MRAGSGIKGTLRGPRGPKKLLFCVTFLLNLRPNKLICLTFFFFVANYATKFGLVELTKLVSD